MGKMWWTLLLWTRLCKDKYHNKQSIQKEDGHKVVLMEDTEEYMNQDGKLMKGWQGLGYDGPYIGEGQA